MGLVSPINAAVFAGTTNALALGHPFSSPAYTDTPGVPIGPDVFGREMVRLDPWMLKDAGVINSTFGLVLGLKNTGKSATMKIIAMRLMLLAAGYESMRVAINDYKPEGTESEYAALSRVTGSKVFSMANMSVNPFESRLFLDNNSDVHAIGILNTAEVLCEYANNSQPLSGHEGTALRIAVYTMLQTEESLWSPHSLQKLLRSLTDEQISKYFSQLDSRLEAQLVTRQAGLQSRELSATVGEQIRKLVKARDNHDLRDIQVAGDRVSTMLARVLFGSYGHMFGNEHSLYDMLTQRTITKDWRGVSPEAETLMRIIDTRIKMSAIEKNRVDLLPHIELDDEKHKSMTNPVYAETHSFFSEIARGTHTLNLSATHRLNSIRPGAVGSHLYNLGNTIINNLGFVFIGRQNNEPDITKELKERYQLTDWDVSQITSLPPHVFGMKLGETEPMRYVKIMATPMDLEILGTNAATDRMITRPDVMSQEDLARFAATNNMNYQPQNGEE